MLLTPLMHIFSKSEAVDRTLLQGYETLDTEEGSLQVSSNEKDEMDFFWYFSKVETNNHSA